MKILKYDFPKEWTELEVYPISDLHIGDSKTDIPLIKKFIEYVSKKENAVVILNGDLMNNAIIGSKSDIYNDTMPPREQKKFLVELLKPIKDKILMINSGNHEYRTKQSTNIDLSEEIAISLGIEDKYFENGGFVKINVGKGRGNNQISYIIHATHGFFGGKKVGSTLNNLDNYSSQYEGVDVFIMGHAHKKGASKILKHSVDLIHETIKTREVLLTVASAWQNYGGYAMRMMLNASPKGETPILLSGIEKKAECKV